MKDGMPVLISPEQLDGGKAFGACVLSFFDGMLPAHRQLLSHGLAACGGEPEKLLVVLCTENKHDKSPDKSSRTLLSRDERLRMLQSMGFCQVMAWPIHGGEEAEADLKWPFSVPAITGQTGRMIPGPDLWAHKAFSALADGSRQQINSEIAFLDTHFRSHSENEKARALAMLDAGQTNELAEWLGYAYPLAGLVVEGNKIGRTLGYPTANLQLADKRKAIPAQGVYTAMVRQGEKWYKSMVNIGIRPTLDLKNVTIEAHLFHFDEDIYGEQICISFLSRIRDEMRFRSLADLKWQLDGDREEALEHLHRELPRIRNNDFAWKA